MDIDMRSNAATEEHRANSDSSEDRTSASDSGGPSTFSEPAGDNQTNPSDSRGPSASKPGVDLWPLFNSKVKD